MRFSPLVLVFGLAASSMAVPGVSQRPDDQLAPKSVALLKQGEASAAAGKYQEADDEFETTSTDEAWSAEPTDDGPELSTHSVGKPLRKQSALRSIEERRERERLRRELEDFDFESGQRIELD